MILSGINRGANLGSETVFSGTVGAAMTGLLFGIASVALSQAFSDRDAVPWATAERLAPEVLRRLAGLASTGGACLNVNFPDCPAERAGPLTLTRQGAGRLDGIEVVSRTDPRGLQYHWLQLRRGRDEDAPGSETAALAGGAISLTPLRFERTDEDRLAELRALLG